MLTWLLCASASCAPAAPSTFHADISGQSPLLPFYRVLHALDDGSAKTPVQIVQIGDSHTANDGFSGRLRELFQARFGDAGRGMLPPGIPFQFYHPAQVTVTEAGWNTIGSLKPANSGPWGISGVREHADGPATMTLASTQAGGLGQVQVEALGRPDGGTIDLAWSGSGPTASFSTRAPAGAAKIWFDVPAGPAAASLTLRARGDGPVDLLSWTTVLQKPGITYANMGTIGATIDLIGRWDRGLVQSELGRLHPALILIAFGTNEGFSKTTDLATYRSTYAAHVDSLHAAAPQAAIVIIGPPDGTRAFSAENAGDQRCPPSSAAEARSGWAVPEHLATIRGDIRAYAESRGYFYWDWSSAMGGPCSMARWAAATPPLSSADHLHLVRLGYRLTAQKLFDAIMQSYPDAAGASQGR